MSLVDQLREMIPDPEEMTNFIISDPGLTHRCHLVAGEIFANLMTHINTKLANQEPVSDKYNEVFRHLVGQSGRGHLIGLLELVDHESILVRVATRYFLSNRKNSILSIRSPNLGLHIRG